MLMAAAVMASVGLLAAGYVLINDAQSRHALEHRAALHAALAMIRPADGQKQPFDRATLSQLERLAAVRDLRFEREPASGRELQSVVNPQGRIDGWLSWQAPRLLAQTDTLLWMILVLAGLTGLGAVAFALWRLRSSMHALEASERRAWSLAHEDGLTGLSNYRHLSERIDEALAMRSEDGVVTLVLVDVDGFDEVNQTHGHRGGDELLKAWAERMREAVGEDTVLGRFDGDQFAILMVDAAADAVQPSLAQLSTTLSRPYWLSERPIQVGCTMGFAQAPQQANSRIELIRCAELALRAGKRARRGDVVPFASGDGCRDSPSGGSSSANSSARSRMTTLDVHYQPIVVIRRRAHRRRRGAAALESPRARRDPADHLRAGRRAGRADGAARRRSFCAGRWPTRALDGHVHRGQPVAGAGARSGADRTGAEQSDARPACRRQRLLLEVTEGVLIDNPGRGQDAARRPAGASASGWRSTISAPAIPA